MRLTGTEVYDKLINDERILEIQGQIKFYLGDVSIIVKQRDVVGNIMQEWLRGWLDKNEIEYSLNDNTQMPPDFFLNPDDLSKNLLEVKAFNRNAGPGFDIADFRMYQSEIIQKPYMLDVDYLIFGYDMSDEGVVTIKDLWIKKVWEITRRMENWPINLQIKEGHVHKIRPGVWYSEDNSRTDYAIFNSLEHFISAMEETVYQNDETRRDAAQWKNRFNTAYRNYYGEGLEIPRWYEIKEQYDMKRIRKIAKAEDAVILAEEKCRLQEEKVNKNIRKLEQARMRGNEEKIQKAEETLYKSQLKLNDMASKVEEKKLDYQTIRDDR